MNIFSYPIRWICWTLEFNSCSLLFCWGKRVTCIQIYFVDTSFIISLLEQWLKFSLSFHQYAFISFSCVTLLFRFICDHCKMSSVWKVTLTIRELKPCLCRNLHYASLLKYMPSLFLGIIKWSDWVSLLLYLTQSYNNTYLHFLYYCSTEFWFYIEPFYWV